MFVGTIQFPAFAGLRCLMMPYIQGDPFSVPEPFRPYAGILRSVFVREGDIGFLTIDESTATAGTPHRGARAKHGRALHTEAGKLPGTIYNWGGTTTWGGKPHVTVDANVQILIANSLDGSCAVWDAVHEDTSQDGDIGDVAERYPYSDAVLLNAGEVHRIGILTPHESLPVKATVERQFLRIVSAGVHGRETYFTENPMMSV